MTVNLRHVQYGLNDIAYVILNKCFFIYWELPRRMTPLVAFTSDDSPVYAWIDFLVVSLAGQQWTCLHLIFNDFFLSDSMYECQVGINVVFVIGAFQ